SGGRRGRRRRHRRRETGRGGEGLDRVACRAGGERKRSAHVLPREARGIQGPHADRGSRRAAQNDGRQGSSPRPSGGRLGWGRVGQAGRVGLVAAALLAALAATQGADVDKYEIYAVRYATLANFPVSSLVAGADRSRRLDIAMMIWVLKGNDGRIAIVDSGFH